MIKKKANAVKYDLFDFIATVFVALTSDFIKSYSVYYIYLQYYVYVIQILF